MLKCISCKLRDRMISQKEEEEKREEIRLVAELSKQARLERNNQWMAGVVEKLKRLDADIENQAEDIGVSFDIRRKNIYTSFCNGDQVKANCDVTIKVNNYYTSMHVYDLYPPKENGLITVGIRLYGKPAFNGDADPHICMKVKEEKMFEVIGSLLADVYVPNPDVPWEELYENAGLVLTEPGCNEYYQEQNNKGE